MSSNMFPWMSEYEFKDLPDYTEICELLTAVGKLAMDNNQRLSFHPGQFCVLASPNEKVVLNAINELDKTAQILDLMGLPKSPAAKINIHVGGAYGDKKSALERFCKNYLRTSASVQSKLTVENDDKASMYSVKDLYEGVYKVVGIPIVFDYHHHQFCTGDMTEEEALKAGVPRSQYNVDNPPMKRMRVFKGGSWKDVAYWMSPGTRRALFEDSSTNAIGFRCAMVHAGSNY